MNEFEGQASRTIDADPGAVFDLITDVDRLPEWNGAIERVDQRPDALRVGAEWTVRMHPPRMPHWGSASRVTQLDSDERRFAYETRNTDGNPSTVTWAWRVEPVADGGTNVTVQWHCVLRTFDRRHFAGPMRKRQLAREVPRSLGALADALAER
jgi:uncharacterized protein YndB with AHSA1/START domain